ncbi:MAG: hypothetical protein EA408_13105 [Marinilabiliales bacterium]|nr:MAG: hypothetical protein EA408_13105 [Marinilabiliales bacterium]
MIIAAFFALGATAAAHSINFEVTRHAPAVSVNAYFTRTSPLAGASIVVYAPGQDQPYQTGRTDRQGYFSFIPSVAGDWVFEIDDGRGHRDRLEISVGESFISGVYEEEAAADEQEEVPAGPVVETEVVSPAGIPMFYRIIFGLALIFGITGIFYGIRARQSASKTE